MSGTVNLFEAIGSYNAPKFGGGEEKIIWRTIRGARVGIKNGRIASGPKGLVGRKFRGGGGGPPAGNTRASAGAAVAPKKRSRIGRRKVSDEVVARREAAAARKLKARGAKVVKATEKEARNVSRLAKDVEKESGTVTQTTDLADVRKRVMRGNMGIARKDMPQLDGKVTRNFVDAMKKKGVKVEEKRMKVSDLKATQREVDASKTVGMATAQLNRDINLKKGTRIIVSSDGFILDGHHRWSSLRTLDPNNTMEVYQIDMPMTGILKATKGFPGVTYRGMGK